MWLERTHGNVYRCPERSTDRIEDQWNHDGQNYVADHDWHNRNVRQRHHKANSQRGQKNPETDNRVYADGPNPVAFDPLERKTAPVTGLVHLEPPPKLAASPARWTAANEPSAK